eukprot:5258903-Amphidinium_carterae.2
MEKVANFGKAVKILMRNHMKKKKMRIHFVWVYWQDAENTDALDEEELQPQLVSFAAVQRAKQAQKVARVVCTYKLVKGQRQRTGLTDGS